MDTKFDELLDFPCYQNFKVMGLAQPELPELIVTRLQEHAPDDYSPTVKPSKKGNYHAVSVAVRVTSKEHMETIYTELASIDIVRVVL
jgi:putative lipoic acid-binding regulatory protein